MDAWLVGAICVGAVVLFVRNTLPPDLIAMLVLAALVLLRLVTPAEAIGGFANPATITVGAMFLLSAGLRDTGALDALARGLGRIPGPGRALQLATTATVSLVSAFINNTAAVAVFMPMVLALGRRRGIPASKLLIPLSFAAQFGGVCTLVGTSTNLVVNAMAINAGLPGFGLFDFAPVGILLAVVGAAYLATVGWWLLPDRHGAQQAADTYALREYLFVADVVEGSRLAGRSVARAGIGRGVDLSLLELIRGGERLRPTPRDVFRPGDRLLLQGEAGAALGFAHRSGLRVATETEGAGMVEGDGLQLVEVLVAPGSRAAGRPVATLSRPWTPQARAIAIARHDIVLHSGLATRPLLEGDALLLLVAAADLPALRDDRDFIVLSARDNPGERRRRAPLAFAIVLVVICVAAVGWLPIELAALFGVVAMVLARCLGMDRLYRDLDLRVLVMVAAMLPLGIAMERSGAALALVDGALQLLPADDPVVALAVIYGATALITELLTHNATAVLMTPIAIALAAKLGLSPTPFLVAVILAASTSFSTPIGYQTNTMVYGAGGYRFTDFLRVGVPLNLLFWAVSVWAIPRWFGFALGS
jgi:di/tricarboxylate transporter